MYLGKGNQITISSDEKQIVVELIKRFEDSGFKIWNKIERRFKISRLSWEYVAIVYDPNIKKDIDKAHKP